MIYLEVPARSNTFIVDVLQKIVKHKRQLLISVLMKSIAPSSIIFVLFLTCTMYIIKYTEYVMLHLNMPVISLWKTTIGKEWLYHTAFTKKNFSTRVK